MSTTIHICPKCVAVQVGGDGKCLDPACRSALVERLCPGCVAAEAEIERLKAEDARTLDEMCEARVEYQRLAEIEDAVRVWDVARDAVYDREDVEGHKVGWVVAYAGLLTASGKLHDVLAKGKI